MRNHNGIHEEEGGLNFREKKTAIKWKTTESSGLRTGWGCSKDDKMKDLGINQNWP